MHTPREPSGDLKAAFERYLEEVEAWEAVEQ
jgi:hypothetical protein